MAFTKDHVRRAGADGVVLGLSGGIDSAVAAALAVDALGPSAVTVVMMPSASSAAQDEADARAVAEHLGLTPQLIPVGDIVAAWSKATGIDDRLGLANAAARARMTVLYGIAQQSNRLVCGTGNKSELLVGYFTKHGDGGNDLQPIGDLYKTQVFALARAMDLPKAVVEKPPSAGLWEGQTDEADLGMPYADLDAVLKGIELNRPAASIVERTGLPSATVERVELMVRRSEHKRRPSLVPKVGARTIGIDWRRPVHWG